MDVEMARKTETDREMELREAQEREIAKMVVDILWHSMWIRSALQFYEYAGKGFHGIRQMLKIPPSEDKRPSMSRLRWRLENHVLEEFREIQGDIYRKKKSGKEVVTAEDVFKPNRRELVTYGLQGYEVELSRGELKIFEDTAAGKIEYTAYCRAHEVDPNNVVKIDPV